MKKPFLFSSVLGWIGLVLTVSACGKPRSVPVQSPGKDPIITTKPIYDTAPHYSEKQFKVGQWIQWRKTGKNEVTECERWTVTEIQEYTTELKGDFSKDCTNWKGSYVERVLFYTSTGNVRENTIHIPGKNPIPGKRESIYNRWYGSTEKVKHVLDRSQFGDQFYEAFQLEGETNEEYLNVPDNAFHAIALRFQEEADGVQWKYEYMQSNPEIPVTDDEPQ